MNWIDRDDGPSAASASDPSPVAAALEVYHEALRSGRCVDREAFLTEHAEVADQLADCLDALELLQSVAGELTPVLGPHTNRSPLAHGDILGDFRILREIGRGGMAVVYEAEQLCPPGHRVALKVLPGTPSLDARTLQRFRVETQAAACLNHPNIVPVLAVGFARGTPFYAMRLIHGQSLAEVIRAQRSEGRKTLPSSQAPWTNKSPVGPSPSVAARLGLQAARALDHAHSLGVIHRDIKPSNLIVDAEERLWVTDFGLARIARGDAGLTRTGDLVGTLRYMSPEQVRGEPGAGEPRADIYALGATLYETLTLRPAFDACDRSLLMHRILHDEPLPPRASDPTIPKDLETIVLVAMDKLPAGRYATARELADDLRRFLDGRPIRARRPSLVERSRRWSIRHRGLVATAIAGLVLSLGIVACTLWQAKRVVEANLVKVREARSRERSAFEWAFRINDTITVPLIDEAAAAGMGDEGRRLQSYQHLIAFYDRVAETFEPGDHQLEVIAKAARRAGALRMRIGDRLGCRDYERAIKLGEAMAAKSPGAIWYRTELIGTLREFANRLEDLGDVRAASARRRRACEIAEGLLASDDSKLPCFRKQVIPEFLALSEMLTEGPEATPASRPLAARLRQWVEQNP